MKLHLRATGCHLPYGITALPSTPHKCIHPGLTSDRGRYSIYQPWRDGRLSWPRWLVTHPSTNPEVHGRESNSQLVDHKSDALTTTPPNHLMAGPHWYRSGSRFCWLRQSQIPLQRCVGVEIEFDFLSPSTFCSQNRAGPWFGCKYE